MNPSPTIEEHLTNRDFDTISTYHQVPNVLCNVDGTPLTVSGTKITVPKMSVEWSSETGILLSDYSIELQVARWDGSVIISSTSSALTGNLQINDKIIPFTVGQITSDRYNAAGIFFSLNSSSIALFDSSSRPCYGRWNRINKIKITTNSALTITLKSGTPASTQGAKIKVNYGSRFD